MRTWCDSWTKHCGRQTYLDAIPRKVIVVRYTFGNPAIMNSDIQYLLSLQAVRDRANKVFDIAKRGALNHFEFHPEKLPTATDYIVNVISVCS